LAATRYFYGLWIGTEAERTTVPSYIRDGSRYFATDSQKEYIKIGGIWVAILNTP